MQITQQMDLHELRSMMGDATQQEAGFMRDLLVEEFDGDETDSIPGETWLEMLTEAVREVF